MSTSSIWSARAHDLVGDRLALRDAGDPLDDVVERLEVLDVDRGDDVDAGVEQLLDVLPALLVAGARDVGVGELVDQRDLRAARRGWRRRPSPRSVVPRYSTPARGTTSRSPSCSAVFGAAVGLDEPDDDVGAALAAAAPFVRAWRRSCRRRARRRGRCAACRAPCRSEPTSAVVEGEVELEHVDARLAEEAERAAVGVLVDERRAPRRRRGRARSATRGAWSRALATEMCGSSPEPEAVTASTGTAASAARPFSSR